MADKLIIRKVKDPTERVVVEKRCLSNPPLTAEQFPWRRCPGQWELPAAEFPWVRVERTTVTYYHKEDWEEAPSMIHNRLTGAVATEVSRIATVGPDGPGWWKASDTIVKHYYKELGWENNT